MLAGQERHTSGYYTYRRVSLRTRTINLVYGYTAYLLYLLHPVSGAILRVIKTLNGSLNFVTGELGQLRIVEIN